LKVGPIGCFESSVANNQSPRSNTTEELGHLQACFSHFKLQILLDEITAALY